MANKNKIEKMMLYSTVEKLQKQNKRLQSENDMLHENLDKIDGYRKKYEELIVDVKKIKERYLDGVKAFEELGKVYRDELERAVGK